jgi:hypothetical protein
MAVYQEWKIKFHDSVMELEMSAQLHALETLSPKGIKYVTNQPGLEIHIV